MQLIEIETEGRILKVHILTGATVEKRVMVFGREYENELVADILAQHLRARIFELMKGVRQDVYNQGWHDKSCHRHKADWFPGTMSRYDKRGECIL